MARRKWSYYVGDFETTVFTGQQSTEVWASALVPLYSEDVVVLHSIDDTWEYLKNLKTNVVVYYHNLKFDGNFWLYYFINVLHLKQATVKTGTNFNDVRFLKPKEMLTNTFEYSISNRGQWYSITVKLNKFIIQFRDSLKLLPFSVRAIGKAFKTKHQKLEMKYEGYRYAGCEITPEEQKYIANDVLVVKEALEVMFDQGHKEMTIGACCLKEYKTILTPELYDGLFPDLTTEFIDSELYDYETADAYIRKSYRGGWCYLVKGKENRLYGRGCTADVNSLYPSMMHSESGNRYPVGLPTFWKGNYIPEEATIKNRYYFVRVRTRFYIKDGMLPTIQIKGNYRYPSTQFLESSDVINKTTGEPSAFLTDFDGSIVDTRVTMTMTMTDYALFREHYHVIDFEILDGCWFDTDIGIFDEYIDKYKRIKMNSKGAMRTLAKLFLNNLYGKMAANDDSSFKYAFSKEDGTISFVEVNEHEKTAGYIAVGSAITSYARNFTIRAAQKNYHGVEKAGFIYADTDSIHCDLPTSEVVGITVHPTNFCCWKLESTWDKGLFVRQKTYAEHVIEEDEEPIDDPYWNLKCAGLPDNCKKLFIRSMEGDKPNENDNEEAVEFLKKKRTIEDFKVGLRIPGKLMPKRIVGGVLLTESYYEMRG